MLNRFQERCAVALGFCQHETALQHGLREERQALCLHRLLWRVGLDGGKKGVANLSTTGFAAEGLKASGLPQEDEFWSLVVKFVRKCQNNSEVNTDPEIAAEMKAKGL